MADLRTSIPEKRPARKVSEAEEFDLARKSVTALLVIGIVQFGWGALGMAQWLLGDRSPDAKLIETVIVLVLGLVFLGLALWANANPLSAALTGLALLLAVWFSQLVINPASIMRGIFVKGFVAIALIHAIRIGRTYERLKRGIPPR